MSRGLTNQRPLTSRCGKGLNALFHTNIILAEDFIFLLRCLFYVWLYVLYSSDGHHDRFSSLIGMHSIVTVLWRSPVHPQLVHGNLFLSDRIVPGDMATVTIITANNSALIVAVRKSLCYVRNYTYRGKKYTKLFLILYLIVYISEQQKFWRRGSHQSFFMPLVLLKLIFSFHHYFMDPGYFYGHILNIWRKWH